MITVNNRTHEWKDNMTVKSLLLELHYTYHNIIVKINGIYIPKKDYMKATIDDGDIVLALHMFGGG